MKPEYNLCRGSIGKYLDEMKTSILHANQMVRKLYKVFSRDLGTVDF